MFNKALSNLSQISLHFDIMYTLAVEVLEEEVFAKNYENFGEANTHAK
jgi:hypothetical protein